MKDTEETINMDVLLEKVIQAFMVGESYLNRFNNGMIHVRWPIRNEYEREFSELIIDLYKIIDSGRYIERLPIEFIRLELYLVRLVPKQKNSEILQKIDKILSHFVCNKYKVHEDHRGVLRDFCESFLGTFAITGEKIMDKH